MVTQERQVSEFNEAMNQILRLHNHWLRFANEMTKGVLIKARWTLDNIKGELYYDAKKIDTLEKTKYQDQIEQIDKKINELPLKALKIAKEHKEYDAKAINQIQQNLLYGYLREKEILLRTVQQECGKGAVYKNPEEDEFDD